LAISSRFYGGGTGIRDLSSLPLVLFLKSETNTRELLNLKRVLVQVINALFEVSSILILLGVRPTIGSLHV
jgi:hypothetical protein